MTAPTPTNPAAEPIDVVVIGDGPAGSALARACHELGIEVALVGDDAEWSATYSTWTDDLLDAAGEELLDVDAVIATASAEVWAYGAKPHRLARTYATLDNARLRSELRAGVRHHIARVSDVTVGPVGSSVGHRLDLDDGSAIAARVVIDATGWPARFARRGGEQAPAWQTALGVVLPEPPIGDLGQPTFMDFRRVLGPDGAPSTVGPSGVTTFCYSLPMADGWLVEETVLAARPAIEPIALLPRLAARPRPTPRQRARRRRTHRVRTHPARWLAARPRAADHRLRCCRRLRACGDRVLRCRVDTRRTACRGGHRSSVGGIVGGRRSRSDRRGRVAESDAPHSRACTTTASRCFSISTTTRCVPSSTPSSTCRSMTGRHISGWIPHRARSAP